jgi:hypothetical protein
MASLRNLQAGFAHALRRGDAHAISPYLVANGLEPSQRVGIYANNVRENFLGTLEATFPVLLRLAGRDWLRQVGRRYLLEAPSRHGNLHYVGERFATWLKCEVEDGPYAYFVDVARLEWAYQEVLVAAESGTLDFAALGTMTPADHEALVLEPNPTLRLVDARWPLLAIWRANQPDVIDPPRIDLDAGPSRLLLLRRADHVELRELSSGEFALVQAIARRRPLTLALEQTLEADPAADLSTTLTHLLELGVAERFYLLERSTALSGPVD